MFLKAHLALSKRHDYEVQINEWEVVGKPLYLEIGSPIQLLYLRARSSIPVSSRVSRSNFPGKKILRFSIFFQLLAKLFLNSVVYVVWANKGGKVEDQEL